MNFLKLLIFFVPLFFLNIILFTTPPKVYAYSNPAAVSLLTVSNFAALATTAVSSPIGGTKLNNGDLGITGVGCTNFPSPCSTPGVGGTVIGGTIQNNNGVATQGQTDATAVVTNLNVRGANQSITGGGLTGATLPQGVYDVTSTATDLAGTLTLNGDANSIFIFRFNDTFITASTARVALTGGAQACNVYWTSVAGTTFNDTTSMVGTVFAGSSVTFPGGSATLNGRVIAQTAAITFNNTTINNSSCASSSSSSSSGSSSTICPTLNSGITAPVIIESRRIDADSVFISWGPYTGTDKFIVEYGLENGKWLYSTSVTGFSATINGLPAGQPVWVRIAATNGCSVGIYGLSKLVGGPLLPNAGFDQGKNNIPWYIFLGVFGVLVPLVLIRRKALLLKRKY